MSNGNLATKSFIPWKNNFLPNLKEYLKRSIKETHIRFHIKIIPWKLRILNLKNSLVIYSWSLFFSEKVGRLFEHLLLFPYISKQKINGFKMRNSSNTDEVIKTVLNFLIFFYEKILHAQKAQKHKKHKKDKKYKSTKSTKSIKSTKRK